MRVIAGLAPPEKSAIQVSPSSQSEKTKRRPGTSTSPSVFEPVGMSATGASVSASKTRTPPGS